MNDQNDVPMIEEYKHESAMVHETKKSKYAMIVAGKMTVCLLANGLFFMHNFIRKR